jgi:thiol-disulfide isomerase/thioredoxin
MKVHRLSKLALQKILQGKVDGEITCVIKFYSNGCQYCHELHEPYTKLADEYEDLYFFAFNIGDYPEVEDIVGFQGIPTICLVKTGTNIPSRRLIGEPDTPHKKTWYHMKDIRKFIEREK